MGVKYIHAMVTMPRICSRSLKYTVTADAIIAKPRARIYSPNIIIGKHNMPSIFNLTPENATTIKIIIKLKSILTKQLDTYEIGMTSLGKYIFFTKSWWARIELEPPTIDA